MDGIHIESLEDLLRDTDKIASYYNKIKKGELLVIRKVMKKEKISQVIKYLEGIGRGSLPNYKPIEFGQPNFHRINFDDERAYVKGVFHQFVFYPWNQDIFNLFGTFKQVYWLKNLLSNLDKDKYLKDFEESGCVPRLSFQFYPKNNGYLARHSDPVGEHQLVVPVMVMSKKGEDFENGGLSIELRGQMTNLEEFVEPGDVLFFNAALPHEVEKIDQHEEGDWISFEGRWMLLFAMNKVANNDSIENAKQL